jgi:nitric oxide reductase NorE protein
MSPPAATTSSRSATLEPPGGVLIWIIILVELATFAAALVAFALGRHDEPAVFAAGRAQLSQPLALANTFVLLTGGWLMANGVAAHRAARTLVARRWTLAAAASGVLFMGLKSIEWAHEAKLGYGLHTDAFHTYYWLLTGFHFLHVLVGTVILASLARGIRKGTQRPEEPADVEAGAAFWHMCDLVWLVLYPTIYLLA